MIPCYITSEMSEDFEEALQLGAEAGISTVHLRKHLFGKDIEKVGKDEIGRVKTTLEKFGMKVGVLMPPFGKCDINNPDLIREHHEIFARTMDVAHNLGTRLIRSFPFTGADHSEFGAYFDRIVDNLRPSVERAEANRARRRGRGALSRMRQALPHTPDARAPAAQAVLLQALWREGPPRRPA